MKNIVMCIAFLTSSITYTQQENITEIVGNFNELKVFDRISVTLIKSEENKVEITGIKKREVDIILKDNVLKIRMSLENIWDESNTKVYVYYKKIKILDVNEGSVIKAKKTIESTKLEFRAQEGGSIYADIETGLFLAKAVTGGQVYITGRVNEQDITVTAGGKYFGQKLKCETAQVRINAGGEAEVYATAYLKATTTAGGTIKIYGNPREIDSKKVLGGKIIEVN